MTILPIRLYGLRVLLASLLVALELVTRHPNVSLVFPRSPVERFPRCMLTA